MELNKEYQQIILPITKNKYDLSVLSNKVVDKVTFAQDSWDNDLNEIIIIFTDKTFIAICIEQNEDDRFYLDNSHIGEPITYNDGCLPYTMKGGVMIFVPYIQNRIDCGLWDVTKDEVREIINAKIEKQKEREYQQYLRLKEKFENAEQKRK